MAAAQAATHASNIRDIVRQANAELSNGLQVVTPLVNDFGTLCTELERLRSANRWPANILDLSLPAPTALERSALDANRDNAIAQQDELQLKEWHDRKNAFMIITHATKSHSTANALLRNVPAGRARQAFEVLHNFFRPPDEAGIASAYSAFSMSTMENTGDNIVQFCARVQQNAVALESLGELISDGLRRSVLLNGLLLPQFKDIRVILEQKPGLTFATMQQQLMSHAISHNLLDSAKGSRQQRNVFYADTNEQTENDDNFPNGGTSGAAPCHHWAAGKCRRERCRYSHSGPGMPKAQMDKLMAKMKKDNATANLASTSSKSAPPAAQPPPQAAPPAPAEVPPNSPDTYWQIPPPTQLPFSCNFCHSNHHNTRTCPAVQEITGKLSDAKIFMANVAGVPDPQIPDYDNHSYEEVDETDPEENAWSWKNTKETMADDPKFTWDQVPPEDKRCHCPWGNHWCTNPVPSYDKDPKRNNAKICTDCGPCHNRGNPYCETGHCRASCPKSSDHRSPSVTRHVYLEHLKRGTDLLHAECQRFWETDKPAVTYVDYGAVDNSEVLRRNVPRVQLNTIIAGSPLEKRCTETKMPLLDDFNTSNDHNAWLTACAMFTALRSEAWYFLFQVMLALFCLFGPQSTADTASNAHVSAHCFLAADSATIDHNLWWCDSGCNRFVTNDLNDFVPGSVKFITTPVAVGSGTTQSDRTGTVLLQAHSNATGSASSPGNPSPQTNHQIVAHNVLYLPKCGRKLLPPSPFIRQGCELRLFDKNRVQLLAPDGSCLLEGKEQGGLYYFKAKIISSTCNKNPTTTAYLGLTGGKAVSSTNPEFPRLLLEAHWAYGHLHFDKLRKLLGLKPGENPHCPACSLAKSKREKLQPFYRARSRHANHRYHLDLGFTRNCAVCFQICVDDYTRFSHLDILESKGSAFEAWVELKKLLDNRHAPYKVAFIRTDSDFVYTSNDWLKHARDEGYEHEFSAKYRHDMNPIAERTIQTIGIAFRCMMFQGGAPESDAKFALLHANVIRNNTPTVANFGRTPKEKDLGVRLPLNKRLLKGPLFCLINAHVYSEERPKHGMHSTPCVYLGYDDSNNVFCVKEWATGRITYAADGDWYPNVFPYRANPQFSLNWTRDHDPVAPQGPVSEARPAPHSAPIGPRRSHRQQDYLRSGGLDLRDIPDEDVPPREDAEANFVHPFGSDPQSWDEALASPFANEWIEAGLKELGSFKEHQVFKYFLRSSVPSKSKVWKGKGVFKIHVNPPTADCPWPTLKKFKYRQTIAALRKRMRQGIDFAEKHASTVRWESILLLIALAIFLDLELMLADITTFFLYGDLTDDVDVFMEQPPQWASKEFPPDKYVWKLQRACYGLPQAAHAAQEKLRTVLVEGKYSNSTADDCVFRSGEKFTCKEKPYAATSGYVDDMVTVGTIPGVNQFLDTLKGTFKITAKWNPTEILGVQVERNREKRWAKLHQANYIDKILQEFGMEDAHAADTPMDPGTAKHLMMLPTADVPDEEVNHRYHKLIGMLLWLHKTRPDMAFCVNLLCRFLCNPTKEHLKIASNRPLRYLKATKTWGIVFYAGADGWKFSGASDADLAGDLKTSRSMSGHFVRLGAFGCIAAYCKLERKVSTSTGQAETYALTALAKNLVWLWHLLHDLGFDHSTIGPAEIMTDNQGVARQSNKFVNHAVAKHYRISQAYIRQLVGNLIMKVKEVPTDANPSDFFTKALNAALFTKHRAAIMGPQDSTSL